MITVLVLRQCYDYCVGFEAMLRLPCWCTCIVCYVVHVGGEIPAGFDNRLSSARISIRAGWKKANQAARRRSSVVAAAPMTGSQ